MNLIALSYKAGFENELTYHITVLATLENTGIQYFACLCILQNMTPLTTTFTSKDGFLPPQRLFGPEGFVQ